MAELAGSGLVDSVETHFAAMGMPTYGQAIEQMRYLAEHMPGAFAVLIGDTDDLKEVNDGAGGHQAGDKLIIETGETLASQTAVSGLVALGRRKSRARRPQEDVIPILTPLTATTNYRKGDEFIVVLPDVRYQREVDAWAEQVQTALARRGIGMTLSGRVHAPGETISSLLTSVDRLLKFDKGLRSIVGKTPEQLEAARQIGQLALAHGLSLRELPKIIGFLPFLAYEFDNPKKVLVSSDSSQTAPTEPADLS